MCFRPPTNIELLAQLKSRCHGNQSRATLRTPCDSLKYHNGRRRKTVGKCWERNCFLKASSFPTVSGNRYTTALPGNAWRHKTKHCLKDEEMAPVLHILLPGTPQSSSRSACCCSALTFEAFSVSAASDPR